MPKKSVPENLKIVAAIYLKWTQVQYRAIFPGIMEVKLQYSDAAILAAVGRHIPFLDFP